VVVGKTLALTATVTGSTNTAVTWESSDGSVATIVDGVVTGVSVGSVTITATAVASSKVKALKTIAVVNPTLDSAVLDEVVDNYTATTTLGDYESVVSVTDHGVYESLNDAGFCLVGDSYYVFEKGTTNYVYSASKAVATKAELNGAYTLGALYKQSSFSFYGSSKGIDIYLSSPADGKTEDVAYQTYMDDLNWLVSEKTIQASFTGLKTAVLTDGTHFLGSALFGTSVKDATKSGFIMSTFFSKVGTTTFDITAYTLDEETSGSGTEEPFSSSSSSGKVNPFILGLSLAE